jgi:hypothetical protein
MKGMFNVLFYMFCSNIPNAQEALNEMSLNIILNCFLLLVRAYWRRILLPERTLVTNDILG